MGAVGKIALKPLVMERRRVILREMALNLNSSTVQRKVAARQALAALDALEKYWKKPDKPVAPKPPAPEPAAAGAHGENPSGQVDEATGGEGEDTTEAPKVSETGGIAEKHLPGQHDQRSHGNRGGHVTEDSSLTNFEMSFEDQERLTKTFISAGVSERDFEGLNMITTNVPPGCLDKGEYWQRGDEKIHGIYDRNVIYLHPNALETTAPIHELGHHVAYYRFGGYSSEGSLLLEAHHKLPEMKKMVWHAMGLRDYAFKNASELLAEMYVVAHYGNSQQRQRLAKVWDRRMSDPIEIFEGKHV